jgi:uncharacterized repeat protein (TIGR02543 family)
MKKSIYVTAVVFLLLAMGCDTMAGPEPGPGTDQNGRAAVSLAIAGMDSRSVLPAVPAVDDVAKWRLRGGKTNESQKWLTELFADYANEILYLETGEWDFTLEGYKDESGSLLILEGSLEGQTISLVGPNTLEFTVASLEKGTGTVNITIKLPEGHGIDQVKVYKDGEALTLESQLTFENDQIVFTTDYTAGDYYFSFRLYKESDGGPPDLYGVVSELVSVRQNLTSTGSYTLAQKDLNLRYVITYHLNGGVLGEGVPNPAFYRHTDADFVLPEPTRDGYDFVAWHNNEALEEGLVTKIEQGETGDKVFWAEWKIITYDIIYMPNDGEINYGDNPATYNVEQEVTLQDPPKRDNYEFGGWYSDDQFNDQINTPAIQKGSTGTKTFWAKWKPLAAIAITPLSPLSDPFIDGPAMSFPVNQQQEFSISARWKDLIPVAYQWYWNGTLIGEESSYTLSANSEEAGIYELSVVVTDENGRKLSARLQVIIMAAQGSEG